MMNGQPSPMQDYMANYGQRLQSLLDGGPMPMPDNTSQLAPGSPTTFPDTTPGAAGPGSAVPGLPQQAAPTQQGTSFKQKWDDSTDHEKKQFTESLEEQLKQGNKTIDSAYDDLVRQMGTRPDEGLSRQDKGMLLMEFGLSLMANSSARAYGRDLGGAIGASGLSTMQNFQARRDARQQQYDTRRANIESKRAESKSELAKQIVLEGRSEARDQRRAERENSQIQTTITRPDDTVVGVTKGGGVSELALPGGEKVKAKPKLGAGGAGKGGRPLEFDRRYQLYLDTFAPGATGAQLDEAKKRALQFAADPKAATLSEAEMRTMAERSAENFQRSNWLSFRDMKPDEARAWRDKAADETYNRLKRGEDAALTLPANAAPPPANRPGRGSKPVSQLAPPRAPRKVSMPSQEAAQAAIKKGELQKDDVVTIGNRSFKVQ